MALIATINHARLTRSYKKYVRLMEKTSSWGMCNTCNKWAVLVTECWTCVSCHQTDCIA